MLIDALSTTRFQLGKRLFDISCSCLLILLFFPIFLIVALLIRKEIFYASERLGHHGKVFKCYKFRTMVIDADKKLDSVLKRNPNLKKEWVLKQKLKEDPRILPFGKFLRRSSIDELPQLWNVFKGDLSLVGPRPYTVDQRSYLGASSYKILSIRPGLTGLWQTSGRSRTTFQKRIELDLLYIEERSFLFDLYLLLKTIPTVLFDDAY
jgi:exopolysaccharide production protein ExoY